MCRPLTDVRAIDARADAVDLLAANPEIVSLLPWGLHTACSITTATEMHRFAAFASSQE